MSVMTTDELQRAIDALHWSRNELARRLEIDRRTVAKWWRDGEVDRKYENAVKRAIGGGLSGYSDAELLLEIAKRLARASEHAEEMGHKSVPNPGESSPAYDVDRTIPSTSVEGTAGPHSHPRSRS